MVSEKTHVAPLSLPMQQWLAPERDQSIIVAWRGDQSLTLGQLKSDIQQLSSVLYKNNHPRWALYFEDSYSFLVALLAVIYSGHTPILLSHQQQASQLLQQNEYDALLSDLPWQLNCPVLALPAALNTAEPCLPLPYWPDNAELVLFTSGSTQLPTAVRKSIRCMDAESHLLAVRWAQRFEGACVAGSVSHQHLYGLSLRLFMPMSLGLAFDTEVTPYHEQLVAKAQQRTLIFISSPVWLQHLDPQLAPLTCLAVFSAGGPLSFAVAELAQQHLGTLPDEIYGTSESGIIAWRQQQSMTSDWQLWPGLHLQLVAEQQFNLHSPLLDSPPLLLNDSLQLTDELGQFQLLGRRDRVVNIAEKRLSLTHIEQQLQGLPTIDDVAVLALDRDGRTRIAAVVVLTDQGYQTYQALAQGTFIRELRHALRPLLEPIAVPRYWRIVDNIPCNQQGKRTHQQLEGLFL